MRIVAVVRYCPKETSPHSLQPTADEREAVSTPVRDCPDSAGARGHHVASHDGDCGCHGRTESPCPHALGGVDEHAEGAGGGSYFSRTNLYINFVI